jgi:hypothetical protein
MPASEGRSAYLRAIDDESVAMRDDRAGIHWKPWGLPALIDDGQPFPRDSWLTRHETAIERAVVFALGFALVYWLAS